MPHKILAMLLALLLLAACGAPAPAAPQVSASDKPLVTVYKTPT
jgi:ABC-type glycerol-3-phosphate transport system substrate-binding protein